MNKQIFSIFLLVLSLLPLGAPFVLADDLLPEEALDIIDEEVELTALEDELEVVVSADENVGLNRSIIFDASDTVSEVEGVELSYEWFFGDGNRQQGVEVVHSYAEPGAYEVNLVVRDADGNQVTHVHPVFVYERAYVLITNVDSAQDRIDAFVETAREQFLYIELITSYSSQSEFLAEEEMRKQALENISEIESFDQIIVWTNGTSGLTLFSQLDQTLADGFFDSKDIYYVSDDDFGSLSNIARGVYQSIGPNNIILTRPEAVWVLLDVGTAEDYLDVLEQRGIQYEIVDGGLDIRPWNLMSYFVNGMIDRGVPSNVIRLILMLPIIVTIVAFMKQVVGLATLGVYTPSILAISFIALDLSFGLIILFAIVFIGTLTRLFLRRYRLLYIPRMAIVLTMVSLTMLLLLYIGSYFGLSNVTSIAIFPMLIMSTLVEKFVSIQSGKGLRSALTLIGEMVLVAILCYFVAEWSWLKVVVLGHPEIIFIFLFINVVLARWSGLRLLEHFRFQEIIRHAEE